MRRIGVPKVLADKANDIVSEQGAEARERRAVLVYLKKRGKELRDAGQHPEAVVAEDLYVEISAGSHR